MFSNGMLALYVAIGAGGWTYLKLARSHGSSAVGMDIAGGSIVGVLTFVFIYTLLKFVLHF